jgi:diadenosine tetraphosphate (Ap4A) HIT family hydrolase
MMEVVFATEAAVRDVVQPDKINLASLGNMVPHVHWHVIPRFADDRHFPNPIWGEVKREEARREVPHDLAIRLRDSLAARLG